MKLSHEETQLVRKLLQDALINATNETVRQKIGDDQAVVVAVNLYCKLAET